MHEPRQTIKPFQDGAHNSYTHLKLKLVLFNLQWRKVHIDLNPYVNLQIIFDINDLLDSNYMGK